MKLYKIFYIIIMIMDFISLIKIFAPSNNRSITESRNEVRTRLKFIGSIQPGEKIDSRSLIVESPTIVTPIKRFFLGDSRHELLQVISSTIDRAIEIVEATIHAEKHCEKLCCANIIHDLILSVKGLASMQKTYSSDKFFICKIDTIIENVQAKICEIQKTKPEILTMKEFCVIDLKGISDDEHKRDDEVLP